MIIYCKKCIPKIVVKLTLSRRIALKTGPIWKTAPAEFFEVDSALSTRDFADNSLNVIIQSGEQLPIIQGFPCWHFFSASVVTDWASKYFIGA